MICITERVFGFPPTPNDMRGNSRLDWDMAKALISTLMQMFSRAIGLTAKPTAMEFLMEWRLFMRDSGKMACLMVRELTSLMTPQSTKASLPMVNPMEGENTPTNFFATKACSKKACLMEKEWFFISRAKPLKASSSKTPSKKVYTST